MIRLHEKEVTRILSRNIKTKYSSVIDGLDDDDDCESELVFIKDENKKETGTETVNSVFQLTGSITSILSFSIIVPIFILVLIHLSKLGDQN